MAGALLARLGYPLFVFSSSRICTHNFHSLGQSKKKLLLGPKMNVISGILDAFVGGEGRDGKVTTASAKSPCQPVSREQAYY